MTGPLAEIRSGPQAYEQLCAAFKARVLQLETNHLAVDVLAGLPVGYTGKLLGGVPMRTIGRLSLGPLLGALGLKLIVAEDLELVEKIGKRLAKRKFREWDAGRRVLAAKKRRKSKFPPGPEHARLMRNRQILTQTPAKRSAIARKAARCRWNKPRPISAETPT